MKAENLFKPDHLLEVQVTMSQKDWEELRSQSDRGNSGMAFMFGGEIPKDRFTQFKADVKIDGTQIKEVGIRTKGFIGSLNPDRPSLKIKFDEYVDQSPIEGLDRLTLNNNVQDESLASQYLTYKLFNKAGIPAPRVSFAKVTVNDEFLGIYSNVESVRSPFLKDHYGDDSGEFYEGTIADFYPIAVERIEAKNKRTEKDKSQAIRLAQLLATQEGFDLEEVEKLVNVKKFIRFWAMENLTGFWDGYSNNQNNYFAYSNPNDNDRFHFMPWGADGAFTDLRGPFGRFGNGDDAPKSIYSQGMLNNRLYHADGIPARYKAVMEDLLENIWNEPEILADLNRIHELTQNHLHRNQNRVDDGIEKVSEFVQARRAEIESELRNWPVSINEPRIPLHTVEVGKMAGTFTTVWKSERVENVTDQGKVDINLVLNGEEVTFTRIGLIAQPEEPPRNFGFGGGGRGDRGGRRSKPPELKSTLTFQGIRKNDGHFVNITFTIANDAFAKSNDKGLTFTGMLATVDPDQDNRGGFPFRSMPKSLSGKLILNEASRTNNAPVSGTMDLIIQESKGGMFGGPPGGGRGRGRGRL